MENQLLIMVLLVAALPFAVSAIGECPAGKGVCVEGRYCKGERRNNPKPHRCVMPNNKRGVCCQGCTTIRGGPGVCIAPERCGNYTRDFLVDRKALTEGQWWKNPSGVCSTTKNTKHYCCPTELQTPTTKHNARSDNDDDGLNAFPSCRTPTNQPGRCVPMDLCDDLYDKFTFNKSKDLESLIRASNCPSKAYNSTSVCCRNPQNPNGLIRHSKAAKFDLDKCGQISVTDKILEGNAAGLGQFPWMTNLMYHREYNGTIIKVTLCSGSLIHQKYVLTAAHCSNPDVKPISVRLGEYDLSKHRDCVGLVCARQFKERLIKKWITHEKADIALVRLERAVKIIPGQISPICLPLTEQWLMTKPTQLTVSGWGQMGNQRYSDVMMYAQLQLVDGHKDCLEEDVICARGKDMAGHCRGDSGGPLQQIVPWGKKYRMVLFGVVSAGAVKCSKTVKRPGLSVSVGYYLRWILDNMEI